MSVILDYLTCWGEWRFRKVINSPTSVLDFANQDKERMLSEIRNSLIPELIEIRGPLICAKSTAEIFKRSYLAAETELLKAVKVSATKRVIELRVDATGDHLDYIQFVAVCLKP